MRLGVEVPAVHSEQLWPDPLSEQAALARRPLSEAVVFRRQDAGGGRNCPVGRDISRIVV